MLSQGCLIRESCSYENICNDRPLAKIRAVGISGCSVPVVARYCDRTNGRYIYVGGGSQVFVPNLLVFGSHLSYM